MSSPVTMPFAAVVMIFVAGMFAGWLLGAVRRKAVVDMTSPANALPNVAKPGLMAALAPSTGKLFQVNTTFKTFRTLNLKCECGNLMKFSDHPGLPLGTEAFPAGDSFTCPKCGKTQNLGDLKHLIEEAMAK